MASATENLRCEAFGRSVAYDMVLFGKSRRRERLRAEGFPDHWRRVVETRVPVFSRLSTDDQRELLGHARVLLEEKHFEGAAGLLMRDEVRITIAAQAALLLLHRDTDYFPRLTSIIVYPGGYIAESKHAEGGIWSEGEESLLGHTQRDLRALVLSWDDAKAGAADPNDGHNLVMHEFAHQLDFEDGSTDGTPLLDSGAQVRAWAQVFGEELDALRRAADAGEATVLDPYGAEDPAEFFAVATETFFERPAELVRHHPRLYNELRRFYRQDPAAW
jgi:Mlc titration factor MtfA (ptsG expression regulator)